jgi:hypothetical protein
MSVKYQPTYTPVVTNAPQEASIMVGSFTDDRGTEPDWLGAIRGGYGNPLKKLRTEKPTSEVVEAAFRDALQTRKMLGSKATSNISIQGSITKFDCSYYFNREAMLIC